MAGFGDLPYVPSPIPFRFSWIYTATANRSGRMQYHKIKPNDSKERISRTEFIEVFNTAHILAMRPIPTEDMSVFQFEFFV